jgi:cyanophycin synthetase
MGFAQRQNLMGGVRKVSERNLRYLINFAVLGRKIGSRSISLASAVSRRLRSQTRVKSTLEEHNRLFRTAAERLGMVVRILDDRFIEISHGDSRLFVSSTNFSFESLTAYWLCGDKHLSADLLKGAALCVPDHTQFRLKDYDRAVDLFEAMEKPVVVKPARGSSGDGVTVGVESKRDFRKAFVKAAAVCPDILVEQFIEGNHWRVTMLNGELIVAFERYTAHVIGDGVTTVKGLVLSSNEALSQFDGFDTGKPIPMNMHARRDLKRQGHTFASVPDNGERVCVRLICNAAVGGRTRDVTDTIHPDYIEIARKAADALGARFAGVDIIAKDVTRSVAQGDYCINEVNTTPDMLCPNYAVEAVRSSVDYASIVLEKAMGMDQCRSVTPLTSGEPPITAGRRVR